MSAKVSKAMKEVWEWKEAAYRDTKNLSPDEQIEFFRKSSEAAIEKYGLEKVKVEEGAYRLRKKIAPGIVAEKEKEYGSD